MVHNFGEKTKEFSPKRKEDVPVFQTPKFRETREKAVEIIESGKYGLTDGDFWILMNETKSGKMAYTGLITSHNACLKINASLQDRFRPDCVSVDKDGYHESLVYTYCCPEQGIYEVGEASAENCKVPYPYAMAFKRMFDRVVLKLSRLSYSGVYSESEADEFRNSRDPEEPEKPKKAEEPKPEEPKPEEPKPEVVLVSEAMLQTIRAEMDRTGVDEAKICKRYSIEKLSDLPAARYAKLMDSLKRTASKA